MQYWHELKYDDWRKYVQKGDRHLPYAPFLRMAVNADFTYPVEAFTGAGIVIAAGGRLLPGAYVTVRLLRDYGCTLPVEIWHLGPHEIPGPWADVFAPYNVTLRDASEERKKHPVLRLGGWELKVYAILLSRFREVLFMDADCHPAADPSYLFECEGYKKSGCMFWPDRIAIDPNNPLWQMFGLTPEATPVIETGQQLIDKETCWKALNIAMHCNERSEFYYRYSHGETTLTALAFMAARLNPAMGPRLIEVPVDREAEDIETLKETPYFRQPGDIRAMFLHRGPDGRVLFQHRSAGGGAQAAFTLDQNRRIQHFAREADCLQYLEELKSELGAKASFWESMTMQFSERISPHRAAGMQALFDLIEARKLWRFVETGTIRQADNWRNDGYFTWFLGKYAMGHGGKLTTIDIDPKAIELSKSVCGSLFPVEYVQSCSVEYLKARTEPIDVLVLDSLDYHEGHWTESQAHCLAEVLAAEKNLHENSVIAIDDCALAAGGKGGLSVPHLLGHGWKSHYKGYLNIMVRG